MEEHRCVSILDWVLEGSRDGTDLKDGEAGYAGIREAGSVWGRLFQEIL